MIGVAWWAYDWAVSQLQAEANCLDQAELLGQPYTPAEVRINGRPVVLAWPVERILVWQDTRKAVGRRKAWTFEDDTSPPGLMETTAW